MMSNLDRTEIDGFVDGHLINFAMVGSRRTCNPPPTDTDDDILILASERWSPRHGLKDFKLDNPSTHYRPEEKTFNSWRRGNINLIITKSPEFFTKFVNATALAKSMNLMRKEDRVTLFKFVLYGEVPEQESK